MNEDDFEEKLGGENYETSLEAWPNYFNHEDVLFDSIQKRIETARWRKDPNIKILEAGSGTGVTTIRLVFLNTRTFISAVDSSKTMIKTAKESIGKLTDRVKFYNDDIGIFLRESMKEYGHVFHPPWIYENKKYHIFCSAKTLHNFVQSEREYIISLAYEALINGGIFALADLIARDDEVQYEEDYQYEMEQISRLKEKNGKLYLYWQKHYEEDRAKKIREGDLIAYMKKVGFQDIKIDYRHHMDAVITAVKN